MYALAPGVGMKRYALLATILICALCVAQEPSQTHAAESANIRVILLGTAGGPRARADRAGISTLIEAGGERFLFDAGRGFMQRMVQAEIPLDGVTKLFLTHLHSDHVLDIPDLMLTPWSGPSERKVPLEVWGPDGTVDMMRYLEKAFAYDIHVRRDVDEKVSAEGIKVIAHEIREGVVYDKNGVKITAFLVDHGPVKPAFGYRLDYRGRSVAISGDTRPSDNLVKFSKGVDVLIHEAIDADALRRIAPSERLFRAFVAHHTTPEQAADIFRRTKPRLAVFSHSLGTPAIVEKTKETYDGKVEMGDDLMVITVGDEVVVDRSKVPERAPMRKPS
jgi:ribonuclease Z